MRIKLMRIKRNESKNGLGFSSFYFSYYFFVCVKNLHANLCTHINLVSLYKNGCRARHVLAFKKSSFVLLE